MESGKTKKLEIIVELRRKDKDLVEHMKEQLKTLKITLKVISCSDIEYKLLAQGAVTPESVYFIEEILTAEKKSNEVYILELSDVNKLLTDIKGDLEEKEGKCTFQKFAEMILKEYARKKANRRCPITIVGVRCGEKLHINPMDTEFSKIEEKEKIDAAVVLARKQPEKL